MKRKPLDQERISKLLGSTRVDLPSTPGFGPAQPSPPPPDWRAIAERLAECLEVCRTEIGVGIHTGLRKAADSDASCVAWRAIGDLPDGEWGHVVNFAVECLGINEALEEYESARGTP